jgi:hypothetical protein
MAHFIIHRNGVYNIYSTITDSPLFDNGLTLEQLENYTKEEYGNHGLEGLPQRLRRAQKTGTSERNSSLMSTIFCNRAGPNESELSFDEFVKEFLTLPLIPSEQAMF